MSASFYNWKGKSEDDKRRSALSYKFPFKETEWEFYGREVKVGNGSWKLISYAWTNPIIPSLIINSFHWNRFICTNVCMSLYIK